LQVTIKVCIKPAKPVTIVSMSHYRPEKTSAHSDTPYRARTMSLKSRSRNQTHRYLKHWQTQQVARSTLMLPRLCSQSLHRNHTPCCPTSFRWQWQYIFWNYSCGG